MSKHIIELENMEFHACHGCYALEQVVGNRFLVNVTIEADLSKPARTDNVADTINYLTVFETVREQIKMWPVGLSMLSDSVSRSARKFV